MSPVTRDLTRDEFVEGLLAEFKLEQGEKGVDVEPTKLLEILERAADRFRLVDPVEDLTSPGFPLTFSTDALAQIKGYDLRAEQDYVYPRGARKVRKRRGKVVKRKLERLTHLVIHQTAVEFGVTERLIRLAGGDRNLALARRFLDVACHGASTRAGFYVLTHPIEDHVNHGNGYNDVSAGWEIDGRYSGLRDDPTTVAREDLDTTWKGDPTELTLQTKMATCAGIAALVEEYRSKGAPMTHIVAHRQSSGTRRSDPGQAIWEEIVLAFCVPELDMIPVQAETLISERSGPGRPIPKEWDPDGVGNY